MATTIQRLRLADLLERCYQETDNAPEDGLQGLTIGDIFAILKVLREDQATCSLCGGSRFIGPSLPRSV